MAMNLKVPTILMVIRRRIKMTFGLLSKIGIFLLISIGGGMASSWYAVEMGMPFNIERQGPWTRWTGAGQSDADPYSRTHFSNRAQILFNANLTIRFEATVDDRNRRLHSSCDYLIEGRNINSPWWTIAVFDNRGRLIPNAAQRYSFNSETVAYSPDGSFAIRLARETRPYNWLPTTQAGRIIVVFEAQKNLSGANILAQKKLNLPTIKRISCR